MMSPESRYSRSSLQDRLRRRDGTSVHRRPVADPREVGGPRPVYYTGPDHSNDSADDRLTPVDPYAALLFSGGTLLLSGYSPALGIAAGLTGLTYMGIRIYRIYSGKK